MIPSGKTAFVIAGIADVIMTAYALWLGYPEGNPLFSWIPSKEIIVACVAFCIVVTIWLVDFIIQRYELSQHTQKIFYAGAIHRFMFGPAGWILYISTAGSMCFPIPGLEQIVVMYIL